MLTTADKKYIDSTINKAVDRSRKVFQDDSNHYLGVLMDQHRHEMRLVKELIETRPTRDEVREIVHDIVHKELGNHVVLYHSS